MFTVILLIKKIYKEVNKGENIDKCLLIVFNNHSIVQNRARIISKRPQVKSNGKQFQTGLNSLVKKKRVLDKHLI